MFGKVYSRILLRIPVAKGSISWTIDKFSLTDLYATILRHAGIKLTGRTPRSFTKPDQQTRKNLFGATGAGLMWCDEGWKLSRYQNGLSTLFDTEADPRTKQLTS